jgi:DNA-binding transcriptional regulator GbsR (MarR family)
VAVLQKEVGSRNVRQALIELEESKIVESRRKGREKEYFLPFTDYSKTPDGVIAEEIWQALNQSQ